MFSFLIKNVVILLVLVGTMKIFIVVFDSRPIVKVVDDLKASVIQESIKVWRLESEDDGVYEI